MADPRVLYWDDGWQLAVVVTEGRKWVTLLDLGTLSRVRIGTGEWARAHKPSIFNLRAPKAAARRLAKRATTRLARRAVKVLHHYAEEIAA